ncbi:MAG TPA: STAS domain-containing protein [Phycisphaerae bacterium]|nr:STAS domain-containing protein [Phycisphaerales bacterium]HRX87519.1 STAS domain-containing protein [Phycisphaerae bacterium]
MEITIEQQDGKYTLVRLKGELRREASRRIEEELHPLIGADAPPVVVDLAGLEAIDSTGLSQLIGLATHARMSRSQVVLFGPTPFVAGVFEVTHLDKWFDIAEDLPGAEAQLGGPQK